MKNFDDFKNSFSPTDLTDICNERINKIAEFEKDIEFDGPAEHLNWFQRSLTLGLIFDLLEKYHDWLNS